MDIYVKNINRNLNEEDKQYIARNEGKLSNTTTTYAKWINNTDEHEDYPGQALVTRNTEVIKHWAQERNGIPSTIPGTGPSNRPGVLEFNFPGYTKNRLQEISWEDWLNTFNERDLAFIYQEKLRNGSQSNFFQLDSPQREHD